MHKLSKVAVLALVASGLAVGQATTSGAAPAGTVGVDKTITIRVTDADKLDAANSCSNTYAPVSPVGQSYDVVASGNAPLGDQYLSFSSPSGVGAFGPQLNVLNEPINDLSVLRFKAKSPSVNGVIRVIVYDANRQGRWIGLKDFNVDKTVWGDAISRDNTNFNWTHYKIDSATKSNSPEGSSTENQLKVRELIALHPGKLAYVDIMVGCTGGTTYLDAIELGDGTNRLTYDLEGYAPNIKWAAYTGANVNQWRSGLTSYTKRGPKFNEYIWASAAGPDGAMLKTRFTLKVWGGSSWIPLETVNTVNNYAQLNEALAGDSRRLPDVRTQYQFCSAAVGVVDGGCSPTLTLNVPFAVGTTATRTIKQGNKITVDTSVTPNLAKKAAGVRVTLQRLVKGRWVSVKVGKTNVAGKVRLVSGRVRTAGTWTLRVVVAGTSRNLSKASKTFPVTIKAKPKRQARPTVSTSTTAGQTDTKSTTPGF